MTSATPSPAAATRSATLPTSAPREGRSAVLTAAFDEPSASGPLTLTVKLLYRSTSQELADRLLGQRTADIPVVEMATVKKTIE